MEIKCIIEGLARLHSLLKDVFSSFDVSKGGLSINKTQERVLMFIKHHKVNNMSTISKMTGLEKGSFTTSVDQLMALGLVERKRSLADRRSISLSLTEKGEEIAEDIIRKVDRHMENKFGVLTEEEKKAFMQALETMAMCLKKMEFKGD